LGARRHRGRSLRLSPPNTACLEPWTYAQPCQSQSHAAESRAAGQAAAATCACATAEERPIERGGENPAAALHVSQHPETQPSTSATPPPTAGRLNNGDAAGIATATRRQSIRPAAHAVGRRPRLHWATIPGNPAASISLPAAAEPCGLRLRPTLICGLRLRASC
jgi:hypothetical protein